MWLPYFEFLTRAAFAAFLVFMIVKPIKFLVLNGWKCLQDNRLSWLEILVWGRSDEEGNFRLSACQIMAGVIMMAFMLPAAATVNRFVFWLIFGWLGLRRFRRLLQRQKIYAEPHWRTE